MTATMLKQPTRFRVKMLQAMRVSVDGITSKEAAVGEETEVTLELGRSLTRDNVAEWIDKPPQVDKKNEAVAAEELRKSRALKGSRVTKTESPTLILSVVFPAGNTIMDLKIAAMLLDDNYYDQDKSYAAFPRELFAEYTPVKNMLLSAYVANPQPKELLSNVVSGLSEMLQGGDNPGMRFRIGNGRLYLSTPYGGNIRVIIKDFETYERALRSGLTVENFSSGGWNDPHLDQFVSYLCAWSDNANREHLA